MLVDKIKFEKYWMEISKKKKLCKFTRKRTFKDKITFILLYEENLKKISLFFFSKTK